VCPPDHPQQRPEPQSLWITPEATGHGGNGVARFRFTRRRFPNRCGARRVSTGPPAATSRASVLVEHPRSHGAWWKWRPTISIHAKAFSETSRVELSPLRLRSIAAADLVGLDTAALRPRASVLVDHPQSHGAWWKWRPTISIHAKAFSEPLSRTRGSTPSNRNKQGVNYSVIPLSFGRIHKRHPIPPCSKTPDVE